MKNILRHASYLISIRVYLNRDPEPEEILILRVLQTPEPLSLKQIQKKVQDLTQSNELQKYFKYRLDYTKYIQSLQRLSQLPTNTEKILKRLKEIGTDINLNELKTEGLIKVITEKNNKYYTLTELGQATLKATEADVKDLLKTYMEKEMKK